LSTDILIEERRDNICELLKEKNILLISELSSILNISKATIRRDLNILAKEKRIIKTYGGAIIQSTKDYDAYFGNIRTLFPVTSGQYSGIIRTAFRHIRTPCRIIK